VAQLATLGGMAIALSILYFVVSLAAMILFFVITAQAVRRREIARLGLAFGTRPAMFVAVCCSYAVFAIIFLILSVLCAKDLIHTI
jgi:hypothetical protein